MRSKNLRERFAELRKERDRMFKKETKDSMKNFRSINYSAIVGYKTIDSKEIYKKKKIKKWFNLILPRNHDHMLL